MKLYRLYLLAACCLALAACNSDKKINFQDYVKNQSSDPFKDQMPESQYFEIDNQQDNSIRGQDGTLIVLPANCFIDKDGNPIQGKVRVELAEAYNASQQIAANITSVAEDGTPLESAGSVFINATANGQQVAIDPENPFYIEMPNNTGQANLQLFSGERDANGKMTWKNPIKAEHYLRVVPLEILNFYPEQFEETVEMGMPFRQHKIATKALKDSIYYSFAANLKRFPYYLIDLKSPTYNKTNFKAGGDPTNWGGQDTLWTPDFCGINPASIKALRDKKFENTLIATREFEQRLQVIFKLCETLRDTAACNGINPQAILELYVNNLDKDLWEIDSMVMKRLRPECDALYAVRPHQSFRAFYNQRLTNVRNAPKSMDLLRNYYQKEFAENQAAAQSAQEKLNAQIEKEQAVTRAMLDEYKTVLEKRWVPKLSTGIFGMPTMGWIMAADPNSEPRRRFQITVPDMKEYSRVHAYVFIEDKGRLYDLDLEEGNIFTESCLPKRNMPYQDQYQCVAVVVAYKGEKPFFYSENFMVNAGGVGLVAKLKATTDADLKATLQQWDSQTNRQNSFLEDLAFQKKIAIEREKQKKADAEWTFLKACWDKAFPCCSYSEGK